MGSSASTFVERRDRVVVAAGVAVGDAEPVQRLDVLGGHAFEERDRARAVGVALGEIDAEADADVAIGRAARQRLLERPRWPAPAGRLSQYACASEM